MGKKKMLASEAKDIGSSPGSLHFCRAALSKFTISELPFSQLSR